MKIYKIKVECRVHSNIRTYKHVFGGNKCFLQKFGFQIQFREKKNGNSKMNFKKKTWTTMPEHMDFIILIIRSLANVIHTQKDLG